MRLQLASVFFLVVSGLLAQDPKAPSKDPATPAAKNPSTSEPKVNKAPDGWSYQKANDATYTVLFPKENSGIVHQNRNFNQAGFTGKQLIMSCTLKDDRELMVIATALGGPAVKDLKIGDVYPLLYNLDKSAPGTKLSELKEVPVGIFKGREYFVTKKGEVERNVVVAIRGRVFQLLITGPDLASVTDKTADTFATSLLVLNLKPATPKKPTDGGDKKTDGNAEKPSEKKPPTDAGEKKPDGKSSEKSSEKKPPTDAGEKKPEAKSTEKPSKEGSEKQ